MLTINNIFGQLKIKMHIFLICIHVNEVNHLYKAQIQALGLAVQIGLITELIPSAFRSVFAERALTNLTVH